MVLESEPLVPITLASGYSNLAPPTCVNLSLQLLLYFPVLCTSLVELSRLWTVSLLRIIGRSSLVREKKVTVRRRLLAKFQKWFDRNVLTPRD